MVARVNNLGHVTDSFPAKILSVPVMLINPQLNSTPITLRDNILDIEITQLELFLGIQMLRM